ncbi:MAG TPA: hypothetical protein VME22_16560 [Solirubrobacteraceae bacterium]|nr:hypothetical protein [Solirubrobacteraceae bacterium]
MTPAHFQSPSRGVERIGVLHAGRTASILESVVLLADTARFRTDDPDALVRASLACPMCLRSDDLEWHAALDGYDPSVECRCPRCEESWRVYLEPQQALRLALMGAD